MKKLLVVLFVLAALAGTSTVAFGEPPPDKLDCTKIQDGVIEYSATHYLAGTPLVVGYDDYGYNYQAHIFSGSYANVYLGPAGFPAYTGDDAAYLADNPAAAAHWAWPYRTTELMIKWDQGWLANVDCDGDFKLDRHIGFPTYIGSGAWETNHMWDSYEGPDGQTCNWEYFTKIIAVPAGAVKVGGTWFADGVEIGPDIWGEFATIQTVYNDPCGGLTGIEYLSPHHAGFGGW